VWIWAETHGEEIERARIAFEKNEVERRDSF